MLEQMTFCLEFVLLGYIFFRYFKVRYFRYLQGFIDNSFIKKPLMKNMGNSLDFLVMNFSNNLYLLFLNDSDLRLFFKAKFILRDLFLRKTNIALMTGTTIVKIFPFGNE